MIFITTKVPEIFTWFEETFGETFRRREEKHIATSKGCDMQQRKTRKLKECLDFDFTMKKNHCKLFRSSFYVTKMFIFHAS
jgi:hypothetical protein